MIILHVQFVGIWRRFLENNTLHDQACVHAIIIIYTLEFGAALNIDVFAAFERQTQLTIWQANKKGNKAKDAKGRKKQPKRKAAKTGKSGKDGKTSGSKNKKQKRSKSSSSDSEETETEEQKQKREAKEKDDARKKAEKEAAEAKKKQEKATEKAKTDEFKKDHRKGTQAGTRWLVWVDVKNTLNAMQIYHRYPKIVRCEISIYLWKSWQSLGISPVPASNHIANEALNKVGAAIVKASTMDEKLSKMQLAIF